jgi:SAM-dependent methyltransferase
MRRGEYGYDAPYGLAMFAAMAAVSGAFAVSTWRQTVGHVYDSHCGWEPVHLAWAWTFYSAFFLGNAASFFYTTRRGKLVEWERILDRLALRGDERVLDMGCGRGAVLTAVARRLTAGRVTGVDIWSKKDQSGNARDVALRNASLEGVGDRVQIDTGDMRALPYPDASFDLVVSSLAIHNIRRTRGRRAAIREAFRVLAPGGRIAIADLRATTLYAQELRAAGAIDVQRRRLGWRFWWGNPFACTRLVTASKSNPISGSRDAHTVR